MPELREDQSYMQFILPKRAKAEVIEQAKEEKVSQSALIRRALQFYFDEKTTRAVDFDADIITYEVKNGE